MDKKIIKHNNKKRKFMEIEIYLLFLKFLFLSKNIYNLNLYFFFWKKFNNNNIFFCYRNFCVISGRFKKIFRFCQFSRIKIRESFYQSNIFGLQKTSW